MSVLTTRISATAMPSLAGFTSRFNSWRARRADVARLSAELFSYSDRQLCDLGVSRSDIPAIAAGEWRRA